MAAPYYFIPPATTALNDADVFNFMQGVVSQALGRLVPESGVVVQLVTGTLTSSGIQFAVDTSKVALNYTDDGSEIQIGDDLYPIDILTDSAIQAAAGLAIITSLGLASVSLPAMVVSGAVSLVYSRFIDPITEDVLKTLDGKDMVQFFDASEQNAAGLIFPDGIPGRATDAVQAFITHPSSRGLDLTTGHIQLDTDVFIDDYYKIIDGAAFQAIVDRTGVPLSDFLATSSGESVMGNVCF